MKVAGAQGEHAREDGAQIGIGRDPPTLATFLARLPLVIADGARQWQPLYVRLELYCGAPDEGLPTREPYRANGRVPSSRPSVTIHGGPQTLDDEARLRR